MSVTSASPSTEPIFAISAGAARKRYAGSTRSSKIATGPIGCSSSASRPSTRTTRGLSCRPAVLGRSTLPPSAGKSRPRSPTQSSSTGSTRRPTATSFATDSACAFCTRWQQQAPQWKSSTPMARQPPRTYPSIFHRTNRSSICGASRTNSPMAVGRPSGCSVRSTRWKTTATGPTHRSRPTAHRSRFLSRWKFVPAMSSIR